MPGSTPRGYTYATADDENDLGLISQRLAEQIDADVQGVANAVAAAPTMTAPTLEAGWQNLANHLPSEYGKHFGETILGGTLQATTAKGIGALIFTLPPGSRPRGRLRFPAAAGPTSAVVEVLPTGAVVTGTAVAASGTIALDGIRFLAATS